MAKTYICSDIHSHLDVFEKAIAKLAPDDKLYILGDAVDKGPDGIQVLLRIMEEPRCEMIMGNHDLMFLQYLACYKFCNDRWEFDDIDYCWRYRNGGRSTLADYKKLSEEKKEEVYNFLKSLPIVKLIEVNNRKFVLVHAGINFIHEDIPTEDIYLDKLLDKKKDYDSWEWQNDYVWYRKETHIPDYITVTGHTFVQYYGQNEVIWNDNWVDIDLGLAMRQEGYSKLALMCLDDLSVEYITPEKL